MSKHVEGALTAQGVKVAIVVSRFNSTITEGLLQGALDCLARHGAAADDSLVFRVPGAWEIPPATQRVVAKGGFDAVVTLGAIIRGETPHFDHLAAAVTKSLAGIALDAEIPVIYGVLTTDTVEQAINRSGAKQGNKGWEAALSALEMVSLYRRIE